MREWLFDRWEHVLCVLLLVSRLTDIGTTWLVTPRLLLEANPIVRRFRWGFAPITLLACLIPYFHTGFALATLVAFLLVSANNARGIWLVRSLGEERYLAVLREAGSRSSARAAFGWSLVTPAFYVSIAGLLWVLARDASDWSAWAALGLVMYAMMQVVHGSRFLVRLVRSVASR